MKKIALVCSNFLNIDQHTKKGTEIFVHMLANGLARYADKNAFDFTAFASGDSQLPVGVESVAKQPSSADPRIMVNGKHIIFELALISKAFSMQDEFDLYHVNIGDGDIVIPFAPFVSKPIVVTLHNIYNEDYTRRYFSLFNQYKHVHFVSASDSQRKILPDLNYAGTIYHGIELEDFAFDPKGGECMMWAGRAIPQKGADLVIQVAKEVKQPAKLFGVSKPEYQEWLQEKLQKAVSDPTLPASISLALDYERARLVPHFQTSKAFLFPTHFEEAFGLVLVEAMACGTPVIAFARGAVPEVVEDGVTGFIVNPSDTDIRGDWVIKKTGLEGLCEAAERIYALSEEEYRQMRLACRKRVEQYFTVERMAGQYAQLYARIIGQHK